MARIAPHLKTYGISRLARLTELDKIGIPVWNAVAPNSRSIVINQGKGIEDIDAKVSAAMEALERAVAGEPSVGARQNSGRELTQGGCRVNYLPSLILAGQADLRDDERTAWVCGSDLADGQKTWVPLDAVRLDDTRLNRFWQSSDGLASGNTLEEATLHGLLERIERDAEVLAQFGSERERQDNCVDYESFDDPIVSSLGRQVVQAGFRLQLFDITTDIGITCIEAFIVPELAPQGRLTYVEMTRGAGAHVSPVRAAIRAITEAAQSRLTYISGARDDIHPDAFSKPLPDHLQSALSMQGRPFRPSRVVVPQGSVGEMLGGVLARLKEKNITSVIVVDLSPADAPFKVAKVLVPGLENPDGHRTRRLGPRAIKRVLASR